MAVLDSNIKTRQTVKTVFKNNWFMIKLCFKAAPVYVITFILDAIRNQVSIFFEHIVCIGYVLEAAEFGYPFEEVMFYVLLLATCVTLGMVFTVAAGDYWAATGKPRVFQLVRLMLYEKAQQIDLECYDDPEYYNNFVLAVKEVDKQVDRVMEFMRNMASAVTILITSGIYFIMKDITSILFVTASFVLSFVFNQIYNKLNYKLRIMRNPFERKRDYINRVYYLQDYAKEIRLNTEVSAILMNEFEKANEEIYNVDKSYANKKFILGFLRKYVSNDFMSDVVYISYLVFKAAYLHDISFSSVAILYNSSGQLKHGMGMFADTYPYASETSLYVQKIREFLEYEPAVVSKKNFQVPGGAMDISLNNVKFKYNRLHKDIINDVTFTIKPREKIALVGYNGAGKTTLIKLIMRLYDTSSGHIKAYGTDIKDYDIWRYRSSIGTVFQDFMVFAGTVRENVIMEIADESIEDEKVLWSLKHAGFKERLGEMEHGLDTELTAEFYDEGVNLSGGESQKLAISRVFYKDAGLIILDEPSAALDPIAEYQLNHSMIEASEDKTVIFISHRLSTTRIADRIIMLEDGRIAEQGTHDELIAADGKYAQMWKVQAGAYIL